MFMIRNMARKRYLSLNQTAAENIRRLRKSSGLSQAELAWVLEEKTGDRWTVSKVSDIENASKREGTSKRSSRERQITLDELAVIANTFSASLFELLLPNDPDGINIKGVATGDRSTASAVLFKMPGSVLAQDTVDYLAAQNRIPALFRDRVMLGILPDVDVEAPPPWDQVSPGPEMASIRERHGPEIADFIERTNPLIWEAQLALTANKKDEVLPIWRAIRGIVG